MPCLMIKQNKYIRTKGPIYKIINETKDILILFGFMASLGEFEAKTEM